MRFAYKKYSDFKEVPYVGTWIQRIIWVSNFLIEEDYFTLLSFEERVYRSIPHE
jgi:hypothetical protein